MAGDRGIRAGSSGGSLTGGIAGSGGGIGLGSGNVGPAIVLLRCAKSVKGHPTDAAIGRNHSLVSEASEWNQLQREGGWPAHIKSKNVGGNPDHVLICGGDQSRKWIRLSRRASRDERHIRDAVLPSGIYRTIRQCDQGVRCDARARRNVRVRASRGGRRPWRLGASGI